VLHITAAIAISLLQPPGQPSPLPIRRELETTANAADPSPAFPASWVGHWKGSASVGMGDKLQAFTMELIVSPTSDPARHDWTLVYDGHAGRQERKYTLIARDAALGQYVIDENNGIVLDATIIDDVLHSHFVVQGNRIVVREELVKAGADDAAIKVEMVTTVDATSTTTGGKNGVPEVQTWKPVSIQRATLRKQAPGASAGPSTQPDP
jgi:hypothetical protein